MLASIGCAFAGLCYSEFSTMIPIAGSAYTYAYATMGELMAWLIGWDLVLEYAVGASTVAVSWSRYVMSFFQDFGIHFPQQLAASPFEPVTLPESGTVIQGVINLPAMFIVMAISLLLIIGIQESARINAVIVVIKARWSWCSSRWSWAYAGILPEFPLPFILPNTGETGAFGWSGILRGAGLVFFAFIGFDAVSTAAQEAKRPQKDMPIGIIGSLAVCTILYVLFAHVLTGIVNYTELNSAAPVAVAIDRTDYRWLRPAVKLAIVAGYTSVILVMLLGQSRVFYSMSRDGLLPKMFCDIHPKFRTPWRSNLFFMVGTGAVSRDRADTDSGGGHQHRHTVRLRARMRRDHHHAPHASRSSAAVQDAVRSGGADPGNRIQPGLDLRPGVDQLGAAVRMDGNRPGDLFRI